MVQLESVCVYCGSSSGAAPSYAAAAAALGAGLAGAGLTVVYGGGSTGLMGVLADAALAAGGTVIGVIPQGLFSREIAHTGLSELIEVHSMHERKQRMFELADAFVALPGGLGTLEELTEIATWAQLGLHAKPIMTVDVDGYWRPLHVLLEQAVGRGFMKREYLALVANVGAVEEVLPTLRAWQAPTVDKWMDATGT